MRLPSDGKGDELALATVAAAAAAGVMVYDTALAYGDGGAPGHNERLLARALRRCGAHANARIVSKGGMTRAGGGWVPDGRAGAIRRDCEASLEALDGLPISLYLIHAPDPRTPWPTTLRALYRLLDAGLVEHVGVANVNHRQLEEALDYIPLAAVQVGLSLLDDRALRGGVVERCAELGVGVLAHSPLGGPRRAQSLGRHPALVRIAQGCGASPAEVALAWLLGVSEVIVPIPGARRPEAARSAASAAGLRLDDDARLELAREFAWPRSSRRARPTQEPGPEVRELDREVVLIMGIPGAGKSRAATELVSRGYVRLNRDDRGGSLRAIADGLDRELGSGARCAVLDNTYLTRASRSRVVEAARRHGIQTRCIWLETPLAQAQINLVLRLLDRLGRLPGPEELAELGRAEPGVVLPTSQMRALRELEPPSSEEGFSAIERRPFVRSDSDVPGRAGVFIAAPTLSASNWTAALAHGDRGAPRLLFDWIPAGAPDALDRLRARVVREVDGIVEAVVCPHGAGPPRCWCRPPLPGLVLAFAHAHAVDISRSVLVGFRPAHRTLAEALGTRFEAV
jgi:aryl-alcohol dehydrogenase-like predicted oxidoreductase